MCESEREVESENDIRKVWTDVVESDSWYVHRCSFCGKYKKRLKEHWFFSGVYCMNCIMDVLWDNCRSTEEMGL